MLPRNLIFLILSVLVIEPSFASVARYKGTTLAPGSWDYPSNIKDCFVSIDETVNSFTVISSQSSGPFVIQKSSIKHPATDPDYQEVPENFKDADYEASSTESKDGYLRLDFEKINESLVPKSTLIAPADGNTTRYKSCFFTNRLN